MSAHHRAPRTGVPRIARILLAMIVVSLATPAFAQLVNGGFDQGSVGWSWRASNVIQQSNNNPGPCRFRSLGAWQPQSSNFPTDAERGTVYYNVHSVNYGMQHLYTCEEASQIITVPNDPKRLAFAYKLGKKVPYNSLGQSFQPVDLEIVVEPTNGAPSQLVFSRSGRSGLLNPQGRCSTRDCPEWQEAQVSLIPFAGQSIRIRFITGSYEHRGGANSLGQPQSPAYLDDVRLVDAPAPTVHLNANPSVVTMPSSATSGSTTISWSSANLHSLDITVSVDGAQATPFANNIPAGSQTINWIEAGRTYVFTAVGRATPVAASQNYASVTVTGVRAPVPTVQLQASPTEVNVPQGQRGVSQISWSSENLYSLDIKLSVDGGSETTFAGNVLNGSQRADWIEAGRSYDFNAKGKETPNSATVEYGRITVVGVGACGVIGTTPLEGWYLDSSRPNTALQISPRGNSLIFGWLSFDEGGSPIWYFGQPTLDSCGNYAGPIFRYQRHQNGHVEGTVVADVLLSFNGNGGGFHYNFNGQSNTVALDYYQFGFGWGTTNLTGFYADSTRSNSGTYVISQSDIHLVANYVFDSSGNPTWAFGQGYNTTEPDGTQTVTAPMFSYYGSGRCPFCTGPAGPVGAVELGTIKLLPSWTGVLNINGIDGALSGNGVSWPFSMTPHGQL